MSPQKTPVHIVKLDRKKVKFIGEMNLVLIILSSNPKVCQIIDILIDGIPYFYDLILSRDYSEKLHNYFSIDWSHLWLPFNGKPNQIIINREKHMKHLVTNFEGENEIVSFNSNILGNYSTESFFENFKAQTSPFLSNSITSQIENFS